MMNVSDFAKVQTRLMTDEGLPMVYAGILAENVMYRFDDRVREAAVRWANQKLPENFAVDGYVLSDIRAELNCSAFAALSIMDIMLKDPQRVAEGIWMEPGVYFG